MDSEFLAQRICTSHTHTQILKIKIIIRINHPIPIPGPVLKKRKFQF
jgi:hypothetical protein